MISSLWAPDGHDAGAPPAKPTQHDSSLQAAVADLQACLAVGLHPCPPLEDVSRRHFGDRFFSRDVSVSTLGTEAVTPEETWSSMPAGGEASWSASSGAPAPRLQVARLQEKLSQASMSLRRCQDEFEVTREQGDEMHFSPRSPSTALRRDISVLEAEAADLQVEESRLACRLSRVRADLADARAEAARPALPAHQVGAQSPEGGELAVALQLLSCMKDVASTYRSDLFSGDPAAMTQDHQVVAQFLDEIKACQQETSSPMRSSVRSPTSVASPSRPLGVRSPGGHSLAARSPAARSPAVRSPALRSPAVRSPARPSPGKR